MSEEKEIYHAGEAPTDTIRIKKSNPARWSRVTLLELGAGRAQVDDGDGPIWVQWEDIHPDDQGGIAELETFITQVIHFPDGSRLTIKVEAPEGANADLATAAYYRRLLEALDRIEAEAAEPSRQGGTGWKY